MFETASRRTAFLLVGLVCLAPLTSCKTLYYNTMEAFGQHKRDLLVERVVEARDDQEEAKEQFKTALERFSELVEMPDSELRRTYDQLDRELQRCERQANSVREKIGSIETVGRDLFAEWEAELGQYSSEDLRRSSRETLERTRQHYDQLLAAMRRPEVKMESVLVSFRDHVLFLKHNLNAQAVASLQGTVDALQMDTARLIAEMEAAIAEADSFIRSMQSA